MIEQSTINARCGIRYRLLVCINTHEVGTVMAVPLTHQVTEILHSPVGRTGGLGWDHDDG